MRTFSGLKFTVIAGLTSTHSATLRTTGGVAYPIHALQIAAMGMACADSLQFEELVEVCEQEGRWEIMVVASPLNLAGGTGSFLTLSRLFNWDP